MDEMMRYIFGNLRHFNSVITTVRKALRRQKTLNSLMVLGLLSAAVGMYAQHMMICQLNKDIEELQAKSQNFKEAEGD